MTKKPTKRVPKASPAVQEAAPAPDAAGGKLTKAQLIEQVGAQASLTKVQSTGVVNAVLEAMVEALMQEKSVSLSVLGTFSVKVTAARVGINPSTLERMQIPAGKKVSFKVAQTLKSQL